MFLGHFAAGFAAKKINSKPSLATYFLAVQFLDLLWPSLLLLNVEKVRIASRGESVIPLIFTSYPVSHSLIMVIGWAILFAAIYWLIQRDIKAAIVIGLCVISHWFLDLVVHIPDLPLFPGNSPLFGLGLWKFPATTLVVESAMFVVGVYLYLSVTKASNKTGLVGFWSLAIFLFGIHIANAFSPPPPDVIAIALAGQLQWLFVIWAYWVDKNRYTTANINIVEKSRISFPDSHRSILS